jgi:predicted PurR-regulated permease PerM
MEGQFLDNEKEKRAQQKKNSWDMKQYIIIALVIFITFCCCTLFFFMIYRYNGFTDFWKNLGVILQPITIGIVIAYLLNPIMKFLEKHLIHFLKPRMKNGNKVKKTARAAAIAGSLLFLVMIVVLLLAAIIPSISQSIQSMVTKLPEEISNLSDWIDDVTNGNTEVSDMVEEAVKKGTDAIENFWQTDVLTKVQTYLTSITSGVIYGVKLVLNILIGLIISVYVMASKETFAGQAKKMIYAIFKPVRANIIVETVRKSNEIFGGFISGKILDSAIIGVIAYIVLAIMKMPDSILIAVIVGVTNIIPFFGPFIGAIPSFVIIVLQDPMKGIYFLIFIVILQQIDGNIIGPKILGDSTGLSSFWVVFAIMVFGGLWGFPGMLLGVPIMAVIYYIVQRSISYFLKKRGLSDQTSEYIYLTRVDKNTNELVYEEAPKKKRRMSDHEKSDL